MNLSNSMFIKEYNDNLLLLKINSISVGLSDILGRIVEYRCDRDISSVNSIVDILNTLFQNDQDIDFGISKIVSATAINTPESKFDISNSYYHLKLKLDSDRIIWLDEIYGNALKRNLKAVKKVFSLLHNINTGGTFANIDNIISKIREIMDVNEIRNNFQIEKNILSQKENISSSYLKKLPYDFLYHMVSIDNLKDILKLGLLSKEEVTNKSLLKVDISNKKVNNLRERPNPLDQRNIHSFVPLYINPKNPMQYYLNKNNTMKDCIIIKVTPKVLLHKDALITDGNAASKITQFYDSIEKVNETTWQVLNGRYWVNFPDGKRKMCSEVLVHKKIEQFYLESIVLKNTVLLPRLLKLFPNHYGVNIEIDSTIFF